MLQNNVMAFWLASRGYTLIQQNNYPTACYATGIVATFIYAAVSDKIESRWQASLCIGTTFVIGSSILVSDPPTAGYFFAFYLMGTTYAPQALWYSWMADLTAHDVQLRAITTGFMNSFDFAFVSWWPLIFYPATDAPNYHKGYVASLVTGSLTIPLVGLIALLERKGREQGTIGRTVEETVDEESESEARSPAQGAVKGDDAVTKGTTLINPVAVVGA